MTDLTFPPYQVVRDRLQIEGQELPFVLYRQPQACGQAGELQFFYMQPTDLRAIKGRDQETNFRSILTFRWLQIGAEDKVNDRVELSTFLLACAFSIFRKQKALQLVYRDSYLSSKVRFSDVELAQEEIQRIQRICADDDRESVRRELSTLFEPAPPTREQDAALKITCENWLGCGLEKFRQQGWDGLLSWLIELNHWVKKFRKDAKTPPLVRDSLNRFGYLAKTAFYGCYANFWGYLIPWLRGRYGLDESSARLLALWHNQNQPVVVPATQAVSGILLPKIIGRQVLSERGVPPRIQFDVPLIGPRYLADAFGGQVLALHPLTWFLFANEHLCKLVGRFLVSPTFGPIMEDAAAPSSNYRGLVQAVIEAAHLYRKARTTSENLRLRLRFNRTSDAIVPQPNNPAVVDTQAELSRYFGPCPSCGNEQQMLDSEEIAGTETFRLTVKCRGCGQASTPEVSRSDLEFLLS